MSGEKEIKEFQFKLFKLSLVDFIKEKFNPCSSFIRELEDASDADDIKQLFEYNSKDVYKKLGGEDFDEINELERDVSDLNRRVSDLEDELEESEMDFGPTLNDSIKKDLILQYHEQYTPWELEELLKKGKMYLQLEQLVAKA